MQSVETKSLLQAAMALCLLFRLKPVLAPVNLPYCDNQTVTAN
jgi:hypothetical protein